MKMILVDGYNVIHASAGLKMFFNQNVYTAQARLVEMVCKYCSLENIKSYIVFDAYRRIGGQTKEEVSSMVSVVHTAEGKTADSFIERFIAKNKSNYSLIYVITSDLAQGMTVLDERIIPLSPKNFLSEISASVELINKRFSPGTPPFMHYLISDETLKRIQEQRNIRKKEIN